MEPNEKDLRECFKEEEIKFNQKKKRKNLKIKLENKGGIVGGIR